MTSLPRAGSIGAWVLAVRLKTLPAAAAPVIVGTACAHAAGGFHPLSALAALCGALLIQIGTNLANDIFDHEKGADTTLRTGPARAASLGLLSASQMRLGIFFFFGLAIAVGVYLVFRGGWPMVAVGVASILAGLAYTGGPYPLGYHGLGDLFVVLFFGFVAVCGTCYVQVGYVTQSAIITSAASGALATAILVVNNIRDAPTDVLAGKRTLVVRLGKRAGLIEYAGLIFLAYLVPVVLFFTLNYSSWIFLPVASLPAGFLLIFRVVRAENGADYNTALAHTAGLMLLHSTLLSLGIII